MKPHQRRRGARMAVDLSGRPPSPQAPQLAASPRMGILPPGLWHISDYAAPLLARCQPTISAATHVASGEPFLLASAPGGEIAAISATTDAGQQLILKAWGDPIVWAEKQHWWVSPTQAPSSATEAP